MIAAKSLFNISKPKVKTTNRSFDYQIELSAIWLNALETDKSSAFEKSVNHGYGCRCCSPNTSDLIRGRKDRSRGV